MNIMKVVYEKRYKINGSEVTAYFDDRGIAEITDQMLDCLIMAAGGRYIDGSTRFYNTNEEQDDEKRQTERGET